MSTGSHEKQTKLKSPIVMWVGKISLESGKSSLPQSPALSQKGPMRAFTAAFMKPFLGTTKKCENKNLPQLSLALGSRENQNGFLNKERQWNLNLDTMCIASNYVVYQDVKPT